MHTTLYGLKTKKKFTEAAGWRTPKRFAEVFIADI
jgi:hypothetical protein